MLLTNSAEGVTPSGTTPTQGSGGNTGGASGSFFDTVTLPAGGSIVSDSAQAAHGGLSYLLTIGTTAAEAYLAWTTQLGTLGTTATLYSRAYLYVTANPGTAFKLIRVFVGASGGCGGLILTTTGKIATINAAGTTIATSTNSVPLNAWCRIEFDCTPSTTVGVLTARLYLTPDATAADETLNSTGQVLGAGPIDQIRFGPTGTAVASVSCRFDDIGATDAGPMGPSVTGGGTPVLAYMPRWFPAAPGMPGGELFAPWPLPGPSLTTAGQPDSLDSALTVTAAAGAALDVSKAGVVPLAPYAPGWFPAAPSAPGTEPFTAWPLWLGATPKSDPLTASLAVTATGAAALTESKPLNAVSTITAGRAAAETTAKPLTAAQTVTAALAASLDVVKAGTEPVPAYPPAWFPAAPAVPGGEPFAPWPVWSGFGGTATPQDLLTAAATVTATATAALTESKPLTAALTVTAARAATLAEAKPLTAALTVTAARAAALTESKPLAAAQTITAGRAAAEITARPLNAAVTVTAAAVAALTIQSAAPSSLATAPQLRVPGWFPGGPGIPLGEAFAPWPPWTGFLAAPAIIAPALTAGTGKILAGTGPAAAPGSSPAPGGHPGTGPAAAATTGTGQPWLSQYTGAYGDKYGVAEPVTGRPGEGPAPGGSAG